MIYKCKEYAHSNYERSETVELRMSKDGWPEDVATKYAEHRPLYEIEVEFEYDSESDTLIVVEAAIEGTKIVPKFIGIV